MSVWFTIILIVVIGYGYVVFFGAPYIPAKRGDVKKAFDELYKLSEKDTLLDLGSGDGVVLREAARHGARAVGYEIHPVLVVVSRLLSRDRRITVKFANMWRTAFPDDTTVVYLFADGRDIGKLERTIEAEASRLGRELYIISYGFILPSYKSVRTAGAHHLFKISPLQKKKA